MGTPAKEEDWTLDPLGNWSNFVQKTSGTTDLDQSRTVNRVNEISDITETTGPSWVSPAYDRNGNMTTIPKPADPTASFTATYDAWNHLVKTESGSTTVSTYVYDGLHRRVATTADSTPRHFYYTAQWQAIEERLGTSNSAERQFLWGPIYIDHLLLRDRDTSNPPDGTLDERLYALQDQNWNTTSLTPSAGTTLERFAYTAFGDFLIFDVGFASRSTSLFDWNVTYTGQRKDEETRLYGFRRRYYSSPIGVLITRDPLTYVADTNLYRAAFAPAGVDPFGLIARTEVPGSPTTGTHGAFSVQWTFRLHGQFGEELVLVQRISVSITLEACANGFSPTLCNFSYFERVGTIGPMQQAPANPGMSIDTWRSTGFPTYNFRVIKSLNLRRVCATKGRIIMLGQIRALRLDNEVAGEIGGNWQPNRTFSDNDPKCNGITWTSSSFPSNDSFRYFGDAQKLVERETDANNDPVVTRLTARWTCRRAATDLTIEGIEPKGVWS